ncbi:hypothetical protein GQ457_13G020030 [Hibiscus cannabinus]
MFFTIYNSLQLAIMELIIFTGELFRCRLVMPKYAAYASSISVHLKFKTVATKCVHNAHWPFAAITSRIPPPRFDVNSPKLRKPRKLRNFNEGSGSFKSLFAIAVQDRPESNSNWEKRAKPEWLKNVPITVKVDACLRRPKAIQLTHFSYPEPEPEEADGDKRSAEQNEISPCLFPQTNLSTCLMGIVIWRNILNIEQRLRQPRNPANRPSAGGSQANYCFQR